MDSSMMYCVRCGETTCECGLDGEEAVVDDFVFCTFTGELLDKCACEFCVIDVTRIRWWS